MTQPTPQTLTLRLKHHRTTILLHISPLQPFSSIRTELLRALQETNPTGIISHDGHEIPLPRHESEILLARAVDANDLSLGWESLEQDRNDDEGNTVEAVRKEDKKGKAKASATAMVGKPGNKVTDCPQGVGLRDGGVLAFKFKSVVDNEPQDGGGDAVIDVDMEMLKKVEQWDVIVPSMEETYGSGGEGIDLSPLDGDQDA